VTNKSTRKDVVVIGLGNELMSDEGIGVHIVRRFSARQEEFASVDFIEAGSAGMNLLHLIANRKKAVIIDCAKMGVKAGTMRRFTASQVESVKKLGRFSLHEADILQVINLSRQLGECPQGVVFFGIEPGTLKPGQNLSKALCGKIGDYEAKIGKELV
jgi:hydrogenase maturation protease